MPIFLAVSSVDYSVDAQLADTAARDGEPASTVTSAAQDRKSNKIGIKFKKNPSSLKIVSISILLVFCRPRRKLGVNRGSGAEVDASRTGNNARAGL